MRLEAPECRAERVPCDAELGPPASIDRHGRAAGGAACSRETDLAGTDVAVIPGEEVPRASVRAPPDGIRRDGR
jgi:hypothetical protein